MGIEDTILASVIIIVSAMHTAANTTMFSIAFDVEPDLVASTAFVSTLLSVITLPIWFHFLS
jgi:malate permease and related proteins